MRRAPRTVLLLARGGDALARVDAAVERLGHDAIRIDTDRFFAEGSLTVASGPQGLRALLDLDTLELDLSRVFSIWCHSWTGGTASAQTAFAGVLALLEAGGVRLVNSPGRQLRAEHSVVQLQAARSAGLAMPPTLITNDTLAVRTFCKEHGTAAVVVKVLASKTADAVPSAVDDAWLERLGQLRLAPLVVQKRVDAVLEVRAIVVRKQVFAASRPPGNARRAHRLPLAIKRGCVTLIADMGLVTGALTFLVDKAGAHWLTALDPAGEWGSFETDLGLPIADAIAKALVA